MKLFVVAIAGFLFIASCSALPLTEDAKPVAKKDDEVVMKEAVPEPEAVAEPEPVAEGESSPVAHARAGDVVETAHKIPAAVVEATVANVEHKETTMKKKPAVAKADMDDDENEDDDDAKARNSDDEAAAEPEPEAAAEPEPKAKEGEDDD